jgi:hypothetical protein
MGQGRKGTQRSSDGVLVDKEEQMNVWVIRHPNRNREHRTQHHIRPRSRKGRTEPKNLLLMWDIKHRAWHDLFGLATITEAILILQRVKRAKHL